jgi:hypothetical protein
MQIFTARVKGGAIVPGDGVDLPEGSRVTIIVDERDLPVELTPAQEAELARSVADVVSVTELTT